MLPIQPEDPGDGGGGGTGGPTTTPTTPAGLPGTAIFELNFNKHEASSVLEILAYASVRSPDDLIFTAYLGIDGQVYQQSSVNIILDNTSSKGAMPICMPQFIGGVGAGNHTVTFSIRNLEPDGPLTVLAGSTIKITEMKQGAV